MYPGKLFQFVWIRMLFPVWNVAPGGKQELLGVLFQQTARYVRDYPEDVTEEEAEAIRNVIDYDNLAELYVPTLSDDVKFTFNQDCTEEELSDYYKAWFSIFLKHPDCYIQATMNNCYGFFSLPREGTLYFWLVLLFYVNALRRKDYWDLPAGFVLLVSAGVLILSPANGNVRYMLPLIFSAPLLMGLSVIRPFSDRCHQ